MEHKGWHSRGDLPHFDSPDVVQFVTFRLSDRLPAAAVAKLKIAAQPESLRDEMLDRGWGACWPGRDDVAHLVTQVGLACSKARFIRNEEHCRAVVDYIDLIPVRAGLVQEPQLWRWGSARLK
jgi:hypothetical protein